MRLVKPAYRIVGRLFATEAVKTLFTLIEGLMSLEIQQKFEKTGIEALFNGPTLSAQKLDFEINSNSQFLNPGYIGCYANLSGHIFQSIMPWFMIIWQCPFF